MPFIANDKATAAWENDFSKFMALKEETRQKMMMFQMENGQDETKKAAMVTHMKEQFESADANKDGKLDKDEMSVFLKAIIAEAEAKFGEAYPQNDSDLDMRWAAWEGQELSFENFGSYMQQRSAFMKAKMGM